MDRIETDCISVIIKKVDPTFFKFMANSLTKVVSVKSVKNHLFYDVDFKISCLTKDLPYKTP